MSKTDAIRQAIAAGHSKPKAGVEWIKSKYGLDVSTQTFSTTKFQDAHKGVKGKKGRPATQPAPKPAPVTGSAPAVELAKQVKVLCQMYGANAVVEMAALFSD